MCRMYAVRGSPEFASKLTAALRRAAAKDHLSTKKVSHSDGWGSAVFSTDTQKCAKSARPIYSDDYSLKLFEDTAGQVSAVVHARLAAPNEPVRGAIDSHPFSTVIGESTVYLCHNGWVDKYILARGTGLDPAKMNDSEVFLRTLELQNGTVENRLAAAIHDAESKQALKGALNLFVMEVNHDNACRIYYYSDYRDESKALYYDFYSYSRADSASVMSSTVAYEMGLIDESGRTLSPEVRRIPKREVLKL